MTTYSLKQVTPLLNKDELGLFQDSRRGAIGQFSARQIESRLKRSRDLRDKYRDVYRRQTVDTRTGPAGARHPHGGENARTLNKADVLADVVERFDAQHAKLQLAAQARPERSARHHNAPGAPTSRTNPARAQRSRRTTGDAAPAGGADLAMRGSTTVKKRTIARAERAAETQAAELVAVRNGGSVPARARTGQAASTAAKRVTTDKLPTAPKTGGQRALAKAPAPAKTRRTAAATRPAAKLPSLASLKCSVKRAVKIKQEGLYGDEQWAGNGLNGATSNTVVQGGARAAAQGAVPTDIVAQAKRQQVTKQEPVNMKIHASARGRMKAHQASTSRRGAKSG